MVSLPMRTVKAALLSAGMSVLAAMLSVTAGTTADAATVLTFSPLPHRMSAALQGSMCGDTSGNTCQKVDYPFALPVAFERITTAIHEAAAVPPDPDPAADNRIIVFGLSGGAGSAAQWMRDHAADADAPPADRLSFVMIGNPARKYGGSSRRFAATPDTQYQVIDIAQQYDPIADSPDDPFNLLAHLNVMAGILSPLHTDYSQVDINDPRNARWTEGNITYILVPTDRLPLLAPLRFLGLHKLAEQLDAPLREIIERGYNRPVPFPPPTPEPEQPALTESSTHRASLVAGTGTHTDADEVRDDTAADDVRARGDETGSEAASPAGPTAEATEETTEEATEEGTDDSEAPGSPDTDPLADTDEEAVLTRDEETDVAARTRDAVDHGVASGVAKDADDDSDADDDTGDDDSDSDGDSGDDDSDGGSAGE